MEELVRKSGVKEGLCLVNAMHITASVFINDDESGLHHDYEIWLEKLAPHAPTTAYRHNRTGEEERRRPPQTSDHGFRPVGTNFLRRIRRPPPQASAGQNSGRLSLIGQ